MIKTFCYRIFCGIFLGLSTFAPGFSGSVVAITMGIYHDLVRIMSNPLQELKKSLRFFTPLCIGVLVSGVLFVFAFRLLFETYARAMYMLFVGLIAGNLPLIVSQLKKYPFQKAFLLGGFAAFALALSLGIFGVEADAGSVASADVNFLLLAASGFVAGAIALVPGMSISTILMVTGVYWQLIFVASAILHGDLAQFPQMLVFFLFALLGLVLTSRGIKTMFERFPGFSNAGVLGFMSGSLLGIFVQSLHLEDPNFNWILGIVMLLAGLLLSILFALLGRVMGKLQD